MTIAERLFHHVSRRGPHGPKRKGLAGTAIDLALLGAIAGLVATLRRPREEGLEDKRRRHAWSLAAAEPGRGRMADHPGQLPARGWKDVVKRSLKEFREDNIPLISAGVTFYTLLALFPALGVFGALYGLFADVREARQHIDQLAVLLPPDVTSFIGDQMIAAAGGRPDGLSLAVVGGLLISLWSANGAAKSLFLGLNIAYEEQEKRSFLRLTLTTLAFTVGGLVFVLLLLGASIAASAALAYLGPRPAYIVGLLRWPILALAAVGAISVLYRYGPSRDPAKWRWVSWGSAIVTVIWIAASFAFSLYLSHLAHYQQTYGALGAAIAFMMWTYLSTVILLAGAELNSEMEHQTARDTTRGARLPMGMRRARMADTLGAAQ